MITAENGGGNDRSKAVPPLVSPLRFSLPWVKPGGKIWEEKPGGNPRGK